MAGFFLVRDWRRSDFRQASGGPPFTGVTGCVFPGMETQNFNRAGAHALRDGEDGRGSGAGGYVRERAVAGPPDLSLKEQSGEKPFQGLLIHCTKTVGGGA